MGKDIGRDYDDLRLPQSKLLSKSRVTNLLPELFIRILGKIGNGHQTMLYTLLMDGLNLITCAL
jgi:hypothetical protein